MKKVSILSTFLFIIFTFAFAQQPLKKIDKKNKSENNSISNLKWGTKSHVIHCNEFHKTKPLYQIVAKHPVVENKTYPFTEYPDKKDMPVQTFRPEVKAKDSKYGNDPSIIQTEQGYVQGKAPIQNWAGQTATGFRPFDPSGAAGPNHYIQMINSTTYRIWDKTGTVLLTGTFGDLWSPATGNAGDPIILYDKAADRWFMSQFGLPGNNNIYIAVSDGPNPVTASWYTYTYTCPDGPDYLKFSAWQDGYYMTANYAEKIYAFNRTKMLAGDASAEAVYQTYSPPNSGFFVPLPADASDGTMPGAGTPCPVFCYQDDGWTGVTNDAVNIYNASVNWSTLTMNVTQAASLNTNAFDGSYDTNWDDVDQPGTTQKLDGIGGAIMFRAQWKTWSGYNTVVLNWGVQVTASQRGIFWCELRQDQTSGNWSIYQQGIYAPGTDHYWMGSIAMNDLGSIALAYAKANGTSTYMSLAYAGRLSCDPLGTLPISEIISQAGSGSQTSSNRDGDYAQACLDPDGITFWYTGEYMQSGGTAGTRVYSFQLPGSCAPPSLSNVNPTSLYEDRGKEITITGSDLGGCTFTVGGVTGTATSNDGSTAVVVFPPGNYTNSTLTVSNSQGNDTWAMTVSTRNTIPVVSGASATSDNHPTIKSAVDGLAAWYGTTAFSAGDLPGAKIIEVAAGTYTEGVTLNSGLLPDATNTLTIQPLAGNIVIVDATGNNYGFNLSTVDYVTLTGFTVHSADLDNIYAQGNNVTIFYNKTYGSVGGSGIKVETGTSNNVINNLSYSNYKYGIEDLSASNTIKNNTCDDNGGTYTPATGVSLWTEDWESGSYTGWTTSGGWSVYDDPTIARSPTHCAEMTNYSGGVLAYSSVTITGYTNIVVSCWYRDDSNMESADNIKGEYQIDGGGWVQFFADNNDVNTWTNGASAGINTGGTANTLEIRFTATCGLNEYWCVDDISVVGDEAGSASNTGAGLYVTNVTTTVENNIFVSKSGSNSYYALISPGNSVSSDYNTYFKNGNANAFDYNGAQDDTGPIGTNDILSDPLFVGSGDYHIFSTNDSYHGGEWPPATATSGTWTTDGSDSPALDTGNPGDSYANEPASGGRINQGAYGNTVQASKSTSCTYPTTQAINFTATPSVTSINVGWARGNGDAVLVVARDGSAVNADPTDGTSYTANAAFGSGNQIGTGNYVVYDGTGTSVNVTGLTSGNTYYFAIYEYSSTGNCYLTPALTGNSTTTVITFDWTGATNTDWQNTGNWSSGVIPTSTSDVTIANVTNDPIIDDGAITALCNNITIDAGAVLTIAVNGQMTVNGSITNNAGNTGLVINSDDTGTGSLIQNTSGGVDATVNRRFSSSGRQWHMFASPVAAAPFTVLPSTANFYEYNESTADYWTGTAYDAGSVSGWTAPSGSFAQAKGYIYNYFATTLTFTGQLYDNTATSAIAVPYTNNGVTAPNGANYDDFDGWNLIGNPYTSAIDWDDASVAHAAANLTDAVYTYEDGTLHNYTSYVGGTGTNGGTQFIPAMQGFFVKGNNTETGGTLNIGAAARVHNAQGFWKANYTTPDNFIRLKIVNENGYYDETVVKMLDNAGFDMDNGADAYKLYTWDTNVPQIYTRTNSSTDYSINTVKTLNSGSISIPLKVLQTSDNYKIEITEFNFNGINVYLKDNLKNETTEIGLNDILELTTDVSDSDNRFELIFEKSVSGVLFAKNSSVTLYPNPNRGSFYLTVGNASKYNVKITTVTGQVIFNNNFYGNSSKIINLKNQTSGIYFVTVKFADNSTITRKIVIE